MNRFLRLLLNTADILLEPSNRRKIQNRFEDRVEDISSRASRGYGEFVDRMDRVADAIRGEDHTLTHVAGFLAGVGIGVGLGVLFAPASGEETRAAISGRVQSKVQDFEEGARERMREARRATGTEGGMA
jgi:hypothetical protein